MKPIAAGTTSGCLVWLLLFAVLLTCLCPVAFFVAGFSSTLGADTVAGVVGPYLCPANSSAEIITYQTTSQDDFGNSSPATGYAMQCVAADGAIVRAASSDYAFYWTGLLVGGSLIIAAAAALLLAAPLGGLVARFTQRRRGTATL